MLSTDLINVQHNTHQTKRSQHAAHGVLRQNYCSGHRRLRHVLNDDDGSLVQSIDGKPRQFVLDVFDRRQMEVTWHTAVLFV